jgi:hypothetical protein
MTPKLEDHARAVERAVSSHLSSGKPLRLRLSDLDLLLMYFLFWWQVLGWQSGPRGYRQPITEAIDRLVGAGADPQGASAWLRRGAPTVRDEERALRLVVADEPVELPFSSDPGAHLRMAYEVDREETR